MPELQEYVRLLDKTADSPSVEHLCTSSWSKERRRSKATPPIDPGRETRPKTAAYLIQRAFIQEHRQFAIGSVLFDR
jgi:hypothetical protein